MNIHVMTISKMTCTTGCSSVWFHRYNGSNGWQEGWFHDAGSPGLSFVLIARTKWSWCLPFSLCGFYITSLWLKWNPLKKGSRLMFVARNHSLPELDLKFGKKRMSAPHCPAIRAKYGPGQLENICTTLVLFCGGITIWHRVTMSGSKCVLLHSIYNCLHTCFP